MIRLSAFVFLSTTMAWAAAPKPDSIYPAKRTFQKKSSRSGFDFSADRFDLANAYWLAVTSYNAYAEKDEVLSELTAWGFKHEEAEDAENKSFFLTEDRVAKFDIFGNKVEIPYANTQALWAENEEGVILAFRGTSLITNADILTSVQLVTHPTREMGDVHIGFLSAFEVVWDDLYKRLIQLRDKDYDKHRQWLDQLTERDELEWKPYLENMSSWKIPVSEKLTFVKSWKDISAKFVGDEMLRQQNLLLRKLTKTWRSSQKPIWVTGHSLGGSLAQIAAARILLEGCNLKGLYTYGAPRAGKKNFSSKFETMAFEHGVRENVVRFINGLDVVARIPPFTGLMEDLFIEDGWADVGRIKFFPRPQSEEEPINIIINELRYELEQKKYLKDLPLENFDTWISDHDPALYIKNIDNLLERFPK